MVIIIIYNIYIWFFPVKCGLCLLVFHLSQPNLWAMAYADLPVLSLTVLRDICMRVRTFFVFHEIFCSFLLFIKFFNFIAALVIVIIIVLIIMINGDLRQLLFCRVSLQALAIGLQMKCFIRSVHNIFPIDQHLFKNFHFQLS